MKFNCWNRLTALKLCLYLEYYYPHSLLSLPPLMGSSKIQIKNVVIYRSSRPDIFCKKVFLKILQNSLEKACARDSFLIKSQDF